ncbi:MAG: helix-turn-helix transcriptional regulator [Planctomycetaceae bacterium]|nr:helix-turn-helix transcriptional regulator [Planctomycetaceae bacterium]
MTRENEQAAALARKVRARCLPRGWGAGSLARAAGISRTTASQLLAGESSRPHLQTLEKVAAAFDVSLAELSGDAFAAAAPAEADAWVRTSPQDFDRRTNPAVSEVATESPRLFTGWSPDDWDELYSTFGHGGGLNSEGVREAARQINRRREIIQQTKVLLETHLAEVTQRLIDTLYRMVHPIGNVETSPQLEALISAARLRSTTADH